MNQIESRKDEHVRVSIEENVISEDYSKISNMINEEIEYYQALDSDSLPTPPFIKKETNVISTSVAVACMVGELLKKSADKEG